MDSSVEGGSMWIDLAKYSKAHLPLNSEEVKGWWSKVQESSSLTIEMPLTPDTWQYLMKLLARADVSGIKRLDLRLNDWDTAMSGWTEKKLLETVRGYRDVPVTELQGEAIIGFGTVLGTGRFSALTTLMVCAHDTLNPDMLSILGLEGAAIAAVLKTGQFTILRHLVLPVIDGSCFDAIGEALVEGGVSQLISLGIRCLGRYPLTQRIVPQKLDAFLKSGGLKNLRTLWLSDGLLGGLDQWRVLAEAVKYGLLPNLKWLVLSKNKILRHIDLADLVGSPRNWFSSLENLDISRCRITSEQVCSLVDAITSVPETRLALKVLDLSSNDLEDRAVDALVSLAKYCSLPQLKKLDMSQNIRLGLGAFARLMETIQRGHLPSLKELDWRGSIKTSRVITETEEALNEPNSLDEAAEALVQAYFKSEGLTADIRIDWYSVKDKSLEAKAKEYREKNLRLIALRNKLEEEFKVVAPLSCAKVFLCGFPGVGKSTLRKTLERRHLGLRTKLKWETFPRLLKEPPTKGIELSYIQDKKNTMLFLWDLAGQEEFHVLHSTFLADLGFVRGKATMFVLVFNPLFEEDVHAKLLYWLKFVASSSVKHVKRHVIIVLNCFGGKQCTESDRRYWMGLIKDVAARFIDSLYIHPDPFVIDVRVVTSIQPLKDHLFDQARTLLHDVEVGKACFELLKDLKCWSEGENKSQLPIFSWQAFEEGWKLQHKLDKDYPTKNLKIYAS